MKPWERRHVVLTRFRCVIRNKHCFCLCINRPCLAGHFVDNVDWSSPGNTNLSLHWFVTTCVLRILEALQSRAREIFSYRLLSTLAMSHVHHKHYYSICSMIGSISKECPSLGDVPEGLCKIKQSSGCHHNSADASAQPNRPPFRCDQEAVVIIEKHLERCFDPS